MDILTFTIFGLAIVITYSIPIITKSKREFGFYILGVLVGMVLMIRWM